MIICVDNNQKRTGVKDSDIDDFVARANAVDAAIRGMRDGTVDPDKIKIEGIDCDTQEVREEKEVSGMRIDIIAAEYSNPDQNVCAT